MPWIEVNNLRDFLQQSGLLPSIRNCPSCAVVPGHPHGPGCAVERCSACGRQRFSCICDGAHDRMFARWTGFWPGELECLALGLLARWQPDPQYPVPADTLCRTAAFDLNRFIDLGLPKFFWRKPEANSKTQMDTVTKLVDELLVRLAEAGFELPEEVKSDTLPDKAGFILDALVETEITPRS